VDDNDNDDDEDEGEEESALMDVFTLTKVLKDANGKRMMKRKRKSKARKERQEEETQDDSRENCTALVDEECCGLWMMFHLNRQYQKMEMERGRWNRKRNRV
jgi:hypothetical protein